MVTEDAGGSRLDVSRTSTALSPRGETQFYSRPSAATALGVTLRTRMSPADVGADIDDPSLVEVSAPASRRMGMSRVILPSCPGWLIPGHHLEILVWIEVTTSSLTERSRSDRILEVCPAHGMKAHSTFRPRPSSPSWSTGVGDVRPCSHQGAERQPPAGAGC